MGYPTSVGHRLRYSVTTLHHWALTRAKCGAYAAPPEKCNKCNACQVVVSIHGVDGGKCSQYYQ